MKFCQNCGAQVVDQATFCQNCGQSVPVIPVAAPTMSQPVQPVKKKKKGCLIALLVVLGLILILVLGAVFFLRGLFKPYDLGVEVSRRGYEDAIDKIQYTDNRQSVSGDLNDFDLVYQGSTYVSETWTSEEVSSFIGYERPESFPAKHVQVRFNEDGSIDAAGQINVDYVLNEILGGTYSRDDMASYLPMLKYLPENVNVKVSFEGEVIQNQVRGVQLDAAEVMGLSIPSNLIGGQEVNRFLERHLTDFTRRLNRSTGADIERLQVLDGELLLEGTLPESMEMRRR